MKIDELQTRLNKSIEESLLRTRHIITYQTAFDNKILVEGECCLDFSSNDYLGLRQQTKINKLFSKAAKQYGVGSGASVFVSGYSNEHAETEQQFSEWLNMDKAVLFSSGYLANLGVIRALVSRKHTVFSDKLCHASLLDGIHLSRAKHYRYQHCDLIHLKKIAEDFTPNLIITETVFSMQGKIAPIKELVEITKIYQSGLVIDDAHGIGVLGKNGGGICEYIGINQDHFSCLILPLGKAFNAMGAIVAGRQEVIDAVIQFSKSYQYTTALPPAICAAIRESLAVVQEEQWRTAKLKENIRFFIEHAAARLTLTSKDETAIKSILIGDNKKVIAVQKYLLKNGFYVAAILPPTVPNNTARLRISLNCLHTKDQIVQLIDCIVLGIKNVK